MSLSVWLDRLRPATGALLLVVVWWLIHASGAVDPVLLPSPAETARALWKGSVEGTLGVDYKPGNWTFNLNSDFQSSQFADNANTVKESADGSTGRIPGFMLWGARVAYDFGPQMADLNLAFGVKNIFDQDYFIRSYDDNNKGIYAGQPRTLYMQGSLKF